MFFMSDQILPSKDDFTKDNLIRWCPKLGQQIAFSYCCMENSGLPCFRSINCWFEYFDVKKYFKEKLTRDQWEQVFNTKYNPKMLSLMELIEQAKKK
ncbi:MAG: hypothetical protein B6I26_05455 [Desulfobacteraceae bacterium 4572_130]|nr:MAG: hypothetical protein B6I26_05455 [Desulfobacteraceae bacterium 4572_130]